MSVLANYMETLTAISDYSLWKVCKRINQSLSYNFPICSLAGIWITNNYGKAVAFAMHLEKLFLTNPSILPDDDDYLAVSEFLGSLYQL